MVVIVLNKKHFFIFFIFIANLSIAGTKTCNNQAVISDFILNQKLSDEVDQCFKNTAIENFGFKKNKISAYLFDEKIQDHIFYFSFPMMHKVTFYHFEENNFLKKYSYSKVNNTGNEYVSINSINKNNVKIIAITNTENSTQIPFITFSSEDQFTNFIKSKLLYDGLWFGILLLACLITILIYGIKRNKELLFYFLHIFSLVVIQAAFSGYFFSYFNFLPVYWKHRVVVLSCGFLTIGTVGLIYHNFASQGKKLRFLNWYRMIIFVGVAHIILSLIRYDQFTIKMTSYLTLLLSVSTILVCMTSMIFRIKNSLLFLLSLAFFLFSSLAFTLKDLGILSINEIHINYAVKLSLLIEILLLGIVIVRTLLNEEKILSVAKINQEISNNASKIYHDIKSPLTSLKYLFEQVKGKLNEEERSLGAIAIERISDIINGLDLNAKNNDEVDDSNSNAIFPLLSRIISEKRLEYKDRKDVLIEFSNNLDYGVFVQINSKLFSRAISNLINNSIEAKYKNRPLKIIITARNNGNRCFISLQDNGKGISSADLEKVTKPGESIGKTNGKGIGLSSAKEIIEKSGGTLSIESDLDVGTSILLSIQLSKAPKWFEKSISVHGENICIVDDDESIHSLWKDRFENKDKLKLSHLKSEDDFVKWSKGKNLNEYYFLFDYELLNSDRNGIELIEFFELENNSSLVTSHFNSVEIQKKAINLGVRIIPKESASFIKINNSRKKVILIDDEEFVHKSWKMAAKKYDHDLFCYFDVESFLRNSHGFAKETEIFIDENLGKHTSLGHKISKSIYDQGFKNIILSTGKLIDQLPYWIKRQQEKEYPF